MIYELHVGTFTSQGAYGGVVSKLPHLRDLGVTALELMPLSDFAGRRNWGYDGVAPYAPDSSYGRPEELKALVQAAHQAGIMVFLDVVYNHFGPKGNLGLYAPQFFTDRHHTPWGAAINFAADPVRQYFIHNALYWLEEYTSTACASTPCTPSSTNRRATSSKTSPPRCARAIRTATSTSCWRTTPTRRAFSARAATTRSGTTMRTMPTTSSPPASPTATTARTPTRPPGTSRCLAEGFAYQGERSPFTASPAASPAATCRLRLSSTSCRTTTRSATARTASASPRSPTRAS